MHSCLLTGMTSVKVRLLVAVEVKRCGSVEGACNKECPTASAEPLVRVHPRHTALLWLLLPRDGKV